MKKQIKKNTVVIKAKNLFFNFAFYFLKTLYSQTETTSKPTKRSFCFPRTQVHCSYEPTHPKSDTTSTKHRVRTVVAVNTTACIRLTDTEEN